MGLSFKLDKGTLGRSFFLKDSSIIESESMRSSKLSHNSTISEKFFLNDFLVDGNLFTRYAKEVRFTYFCNRRTLLIEFALFSVSGASIRSAFLRDKMATLCHIAIKHCPSSLTAFVEEIASEHLLRTKLHVLACFEFKSLFNRLDKRHGMATATVSLVSHWGSQINSIYTSHIIDFR